MFKKIASSIGRRIRNVFVRSPRESKVEQADFEVLEGVADAVVKEVVVAKETAVVVSAPKAKVKAKTPPRKPAKKRKPPWTLDNFKVDEEEDKVRFHDLDINIPLMHGISDAGFKYCTPIQAQSLGPVLAGMDMVGKANTGTGKTAVFLLGIINKLMADKEAGRGQRNPKALILAPTRELVVQIVKDAKNLGLYSGINVAAVYGGAEYGKQMDLLKSKKIDIVVATPGRLIDFHNKRVLRLDGCQTLVIDEADRMLDMGFIPDVRRIVGWTAKKRDRQTLMFSATISTEVKRLSDQWCNDPVTIVAEADQMTTDTVEQAIYLVTAEEKYHVLYNIIKQNPEDRIIVFTNMKNEARKLSERLKRNDLECVLLSGDVPQNKRQSRLERFRDGKAKVLVATDVAGRGIHIDGITYVVNYTLPYEPEDYVHRIGRTGRAGMAGRSVSFACEEGSFYLPDIEEYVGERLECVVPPEDLLVPAPKGTPPPKGPKSSGYKGKKSYQKSGSHKQGGGGYKGKKKN
ncbi:MAG: DEAD/DEAH box helicase [Desulfotalea sp.]